MKIYYDNSKKGLIIFLSAFIVGFIFYFIIKGYPVYSALLIDLVFAIPLIICISASRKFYIKTYETMLFLQLNILKDI